MRFSEFGIHREPDLRPLLCGSDDSALRSGCYLLRYGHLSFLRDVDYISYIPRLNALPDCIPELHARFAPTGIVDSLHEKEREIQSRSTTADLTVRGKEKKKTGKEVHIALKSEQVVRQSRS